MDQVQRLTGELKIYDTQGNSVNAFRQNNGVFSSALNRGNRSILNNATSGGNETLRRDMFFDSSNSPDARASSTTDGETRTKNVSATAYMRIA